MYFCYGTAGGCGTSVFAAAVALALAETTSTLLVDLGGDLPALLGAPVDGSAGLADWLSADEQVSIDALRRVESPVSDTLAVLGRGGQGLDPGKTDPDRIADLVTALANASRPIVVDAGLGNGPVADRLAARSTHRLLVTKACYVALSRFDAGRVGPTGVVLQREPGRALGKLLVEATLPAPVVATVPYDPAVFRAVDAGLLAQRVPRPLRQAASAVLR